MIEVPFIIWGSDKFKQLHPEKWQAIQQAVNLPYMSDDMIHTVLDIVDIHTSDYEPERSLINRAYNNLRPRIFDDKDYDKEILTGLVQED